MHYKVIHGKTKQVLRQVNTKKIIGWKKIRVTGDDIVSRSILVKLEIPADSRTYFRNVKDVGTNKCRTERAKVLGYYEYDISRMIHVCGKDNVMSRYDNITIKPFEVKPDYILYSDGWGVKFRYPPIGEYVKCEPSFDTSTQECASGIHFFRDVRYAAAY